MLSEEMMARYRNSGLVAMIAIAAFALAARAQADGASTAATLCVNPSGADACFTTISAAVASAQTGATITVASGTYLETLTIGGITTKGKPMSPLKLTIKGAGSTTTIIDAGGSGTVITVNPQSSLALAKFTVQHGGLQGIAVTGGSLSLSNSLVTANGAGGVSFNGLSFRIQQSTISNNTGGSGVSVLDSKGTALILDSTISGNVAPVCLGGGAGVFVGPDTTIANTTISGNQVPFCEYGVSEGGGIFVTGGPLNLNNDTITNNVAPKGGGLEILGDTTASNTIIAGNSTTDGECAGPLFSNGYNLSDTDCVVSGGTGDIIADPLLGPLTDNPPGLNATQAPLAGSPAIGAGAPTVGGYAGPGCASTDERGVKRVAGSCDIGAYQS